MPAPTDENSKYILQILQNTKNPTIDDILNLLGMADRTPNMLVDPKLAGTTSSGYYKPATNTLALSPYGGTINTTVHELTHALNQAMAKSAAPKQTSGDIPPATRQFMEAYRKLDSSPKINLDAPDPDVPKGSSMYNYRRDFDEMRSFGMGNMTDPPPNGKFAPIGQHVDASMATDMQVLMELYKRMLMQKQQ